MKQLVFVFVWCLFTDFSVSYAKLTNEQQIERMSLAKSSKSQLNAKAYQHIIAIDDAAENEVDAAVLAGLCPDSNHPHAIDLGIGVKWACCNVGAYSPEGFGGYYAWGDTEEKGYYYWDTYNYYDSKTDECKNIGSDIAGTSYDVAHVKWGDGWRMPSLDQIKLLLDNCSSEWTILNGVYGQFFTGPNGGKIFLPAAGVRFYDYTSGVGNFGNYWSSTQSPDNRFDAYYLYTYSGDPGWEGSNREYGRGVRPVIEYDEESQALVGDVNNDKIVDISDIVALINIIAGNTSHNSDEDDQAHVGDLNNDMIVDISDIVAVIDIISNGETTENQKDAAVLADLCPDNHHPHAIDLGIGVKWACCNVGASAPEQYGGYYAWGDTEEKNYYSYETYKYITLDHNGVDSIMHFGNIAGTSYDVAHVKWGGGWRMPGYAAHFRLLDENCSSEWTTLNGVNGMVFTGPNGGRIFLPAAGYRRDDGTINVGDHGYYWSSVEILDDTGDAIDLEFYSTDVNQYDYAYRPYGLSVRPVIK